MGINTNLGVATFFSVSANYLPPSSNTHALFSLKVISFPIFINIVRIYINMENTDKLHQIACVLFLFLILHQQVLFVQGRKNLRSRRCRECTKPHDENTTVNMNVVAAGEDHGRKSRRVQYEVEDFRPTSPGHSPGVGHSINN